jgi:organic hydroperoxide reductase OsmC/OhrA
MKPYPHHYRVASTAGPDGEVALSSTGLKSLRSAAPVEFDGPGDLWSPETLLIAALADCFVLTFRAVARASKFPWVSLQCEIEGTLEREAGVTRFTAFELSARLGVPSGTDIELAQRLLHKAEQGCLISNSLTGTRQLTASVDVVV